MFKSQVYTFAAAGMVARHVGRTQQCRARAQCRGSSAMAVPRNSGFTLG